MVILNFFRLPRYFGLACFQTQPIEDEGISNQNISQPRIERHGTCYNDRSCPFFLLIARSYQCPDLPDEHQLQESLRHPLKNKSLKPMRPVCPQLRSATSNSIQCTAGHDPRRWDEKAFIHIIAWAFHASNYHAYHLYIMASRSHLRAQGCAK